MPGLASLTAHLGASPDAQSVFLVRIYMIYKYRYSSAGAPLDSHPARDHGYPSEYY